MNSNINLNPRFASLRITLKRNGDPASAQDVVAIDSSHGRALDLREDRKIYLNGQLVGTNEDLGTLMDQYRSAKDSARIAYHDQFIQRPGDDVRQLLKAYEAQIPNYRTRIINAILSMVPVSGATPVSDQDKLRAVKVVSDFQEPPVDLLFSRKPTEEEVNAAS